MEYVPTELELEEVEEMRGVVECMSSRTLKKEYDAMEALIMEEGYENLLFVSCEYFLMLEEAMIMDDQDVYGDDFG